MLATRSLRMAFLLACAACGAGEATPASEAEQLDATLALDLPMGDDDSVLVGRLHDATRLSDGRLALLDLTSRAVILLSADGNVLRVTGREGSGPGEFELPLWLGRCRADSLYVWDRGRARVAILAPDGAFVREFRPAVTAPFGPECLPNGGFATLDARAAEGAPPAIGNDTDTPQIRGALIIMSSEGDSIAAVPDLPLGQARVFGGLAGMAVAGDRVVVGHNASSELSNYRLDATPIDHDTVPLTPVPLATSRYLEMVDRQVEAMGGDSTLSAQLREMILAEGKSDNTPLFQTMHGSPDGLIWWVTSLPVDSTTTLIGIRGGQLVKRLTLPATIAPFEIGSDYLLGRRSGPDGIERLVLYQWAP